ncbi:MAG: hypothetical protein ABI760_08085 [Ferruginibacter sp.]
MTPSDTSISFARCSSFNSICGIPDGTNILTEFSKVTLRNNFGDGESRWYDIHNIPPLAIDHEDMVRDVQKNLQLQIHNEPIGYNLLPQNFTLPELQTLYEVILDKKLDQRNFTK